MGLDMYLSKQHYVKQWDHISADQQFEVTVTKGGKPYPIDPKRISYVTEQVAYWRKANAIHAWFVRECQDGRDECQESAVSVEQLRTLLKLCQEVSADHGKADELLPTQGGFFFGGTEYDEWYFHDVKDTVEILTKILAEPDSEYADYLYRSSW